MNKHNKLQASKQPSEQVGHGIDEAIECSERASEGTWSSIDGGGANHTVIDHYFSGGRLIERTSITIHTSDVTP